MIIEKYNLIIRNVNNLLQMIVKKYFDYRNINN